MGWSDAARRAAAEARKRRPAIQKLQQRQRQAIHMYNMSGDPRDLKRTDRIVNQTRNAIAKHKAAIAAVKAGPAPKWRVSTKGKGAPRLIERKK